jgi:hypothetical protein
LRADLTSETASRVSAGNTLQNNINNLATTEGNHFADLQSQLNYLAAALNIEQTERTSANVELLSKIDLLFSYFFHHNSNGAYIDSNNQIQFMYGNP